MDMTLSKALDGARNHRHYSDEMQKQPISSPLPTFVRPAIRQSTAKRTPTPPLPGSRARLRHGLVCSSSLEKPHQA
ncbi:hypothetical protein LZ32DRAFT_205032 [Colletotrichum eremochloae]|nr:hypothetical protein LZ32DRAFT_205032 [Colletotrichum eremochloae]